MLRRIRQSVRAKLLVLMLTTTSIALVVAVAALVAYDVRTRPVIALFDIGLPGMTGYELARTLREQRHRTIVLVAVTGWGHDTDRQRAAQAGFDSHLVKPLDPAQLPQSLTAAAERCGP